MRWGTDAAPTFVLRREDAVSVCRMSGRLLAAVRRARNDSANELR
jgi:hypothetical protein